MSNTKHATHSPTTTKISIWAKAPAWLLLLLWAVFPALGLVALFLAILPDFVHLGISMGTKGMLRWVGAGTVLVASMGYLEWLVSIYKLGGLVAGKLDGRKLRRLQVEALLVLVFINCMNYMGSEVMMSHREPPLVFMFALMIGSILSLAALIDLIFGARNALAGLLKSGRASRKDRDDALVWIIIFPVGIWKIQPLLRRRWRELRASVG